MFRHVGPNRGRGGAFDLTQPPPPIVVKIRNFLKQMIQHVRQGTYATFGEVPAKGFGYKATDPLQVRAARTAVMSPADIASRLDSAFAKVDALMQRSEPVYVPEGDEDEPLADDDDDEHVEVSALLGHREGHDGDYEFLVKFRYLDEEPQWLPEEHLHCDALKDAYWADIARSTD